MSQTLVKIRSSELRSKKASGVAAPVEAHLSPRHVGQTHAASKPTKTDVIRSLPSTLSPIEVVEAAKKLGFTVTPNLVSLVRGRDRRNPGPPRRRGRPRKNEVIARAAVVTTPAPVVRFSPSRMNAKAHAGSTTLTTKEKELAGILFEVGLDRVIELVHQLKRALDAV
jgi:hypothetical protein